MPRAPYTSLLDDPEFVAHLDRLELALPPPEARPPAQWFVEEEPSRRWLVTDAAWFGVVGFFVMMGIGGAAAAYVFADRVALILAR